MPLATRERIWEELPPLDGEPEVKVETKEVADGDSVKVVEVRTTTVRKLKCVEERKGWELFGLSEEDIKANDGMSESEEVVWEYPATEKKPQKKQSDKKEYEEIKCRHCGGNHYSHQCTQKTIESEPAEEPSAASSSAGERAPQSAGAPSTGKYSVRDRLGKSSGPSRGGLSSESEEFKVRVSNLDEEASEDDVRELFSLRGRCKVTRCFLKKKYGGGNMGFAYVNYGSEKEALLACEKLNGRPYGHLILSVEMQTKK